MSGIQWSRAFRCASFFFAAALLLLAASQPVAAVEDVFDNESQCWWDPGGNTVCGDAYLSMTVFYSGSGTAITAEIITDVSTEIAYEYAWEGLYVYAESDLYLNDTLLGIAPNGEDGGFAEATDSYTNQPVGTQDFYQLVGTHIATFVGSCGEEGFGEGGGCGCNWDSSYQTYVGLAADMPYIGGLSQNYGTLDSSGSITASGANLVDPSTCTAQVNITGSGDSFSVPDAGCQENSATLNYTINLDASLGLQSLSLTTTAGTSNSVSFANDDPTPVVEQGGINPDQWQAGATGFSVTIKGTGFGTNPTISVSDPSASCTVVSAIDSGGANQATINASCSVSKYDLNNTATVTVTSTGYGNGFSPAPTGASSTPYQVTINSAQGGALPTPQILLGTDTNGNICSSNATNVTNTTVNLIGGATIYVGQPIAFTACVPGAEAGLVNSESWSPTTPASPANPSAIVAVAGFSVTVTGPGPGQTQNDYAQNLTDVSNTLCGLNLYCDYNGFYFVTPGTYTFTFAYTAQGSNATGSAWVSFTIVGPTNVDVTLSGSNSFAPYTIYSQGGVPYMGLLNPNGQQGITLDASANPSFTGSWTPAGAITPWVQVFTNFKVRKLTASGTYTAAYVNVLDTYYPYNAPYGNFGGSFFDAPETSLQTSEWGDSYTATVYLMWDAATPYGCVPFTSEQSEQCSSIPVPLGHLSWGTCGDAVNTLSPQTGQGGTNWTLNCPALETGPSAFVTDSTYPSWQGTIHQGDTLNFVQP